jgi:polyhydroxyalkanoate synthesis repressor PhaR
MENRTTPVTTRTIRKYANRRLYDTADSRYVTLEDLRRLVTEGERFEVVDARDGVDITRTILLQIIVEQEEKGQPLLSSRLLQQLIQYYGGNMQAFVGSYLDRSMDFFDDQQQVLQDQMENLLQTASSSVWQEMAKRNLALWSDMQQELLKSFVTTAAKSKPGKTEDHS